MSRPRPTLLLILDGWGQAPAGPGNAVSLARTPNLDKLLAERPTAPAPVLGPGPWVCPTGSWATPRWAT